jgi:hypothetical protein
MISLLPFSVRDINVALFLFYSSATEEEFITRVSYPRRILNDSLAQTIRDVA